jgi:hypothetical protein
LAGFNGSVERVVDGQVRGGIAALAGRSLAGVVDDNAAHDFGGDAKEMLAIGPLGALLVDHLEIQLMHKRRSLKRMAGAFRAKEPVRQPVKVVVNQGHELFQRVRVSAGPLAQQGRNVATLGVHCVSFRISRPRGLEGTGTTLPRAGGPRR